MTPRTSMPAVGSALSGGSAVRVPRLVIAAPASGSGKTTVATGLMAAFRARGLAVSGHKAGPDYIDPGYHAIATGRPGRNLDPFLCGEDLIAPLFAHGAVQPVPADIAIVEGVMGLFDGAAPDAFPVLAAGGSGACEGLAGPAISGASEGLTGLNGLTGLAGSAGPRAVQDQWLLDGVITPSRGQRSTSGPTGRPADFASTAHVARLLRAPVVLVVDAARAGRSVAALIAGFAGFDPRVPVAGVIFNRVGSDRHERLLRDAAEPSGIPVLGAIRRTDALGTPARHLGLVPAAERLEAARREIRALASVVGASCDLPGLRELAASAPPLPVTPWDPAAALEASRSDDPGESAARWPAAGQDHRSQRRAAGAPVVAVAQGPAFTFSYAEHAELLEAAGAQVAPFDPLTDEALPVGTSGLVIGGGFPEVHAGQLSANAPLRSQVRELATSGAPVVAECAGLLYLARSLDGQPMCGVIGAHARMTGQLTLGYRSAEAASDSVLARSGDPVRGHEFHRTAAEPEHGPRPAWRWPGNQAEPGRIEGHVQRNLVASYLHLHWADRPEAARRLVAACEHEGARLNAPASGVS